MLAAALAMIVANSPGHSVYDYILNQMNLRVGFSDADGHGMLIEKTVLHWVNDGLMAVFFFLVGLEIKREILMGGLNSRAKAILPIFAAIGGMVVPALIYAFINRGNEGTLAGWAIPCATDIAFALGVLSLLGRRVPVALKILLTAVAIIDDLGAIIVIAIFYTSSLHIYALLFATLPLLGLFILNRTGVTRTAPYVLLSLVLWTAVLESGVHATLAGVIAALFIPLRTNEARKSTAERLEHGLHPWVAFLILPLFGFANAGVPLAGVGPAAVLEPVTLGIILGLVAGKQLGVFGAVWLAIKSGLSPKPEGLSWMHLYGMSLLCGIGFTMSLFIGGLAFTGTELQEEVRLGVLGGSLISALGAYIVFKIIGKRNVIR